MAAGPFLRVEQLFSRQKPVLRNASTMLVRDALQAGMSELIRPMPRATMMQAEATKGSNDRIGGRKAAAGLLLTHTRESGGPCVFWRVAAGRTWRPTLPSRQ